VRRLFGLMKAGGNDMREMMCALSVVGVLALLAASADTAWAQPQTPPPIAHAGGQMGGYDGDFLLPFLLRTVNLTSDQETKVRGILSSHQTSTASLGAQLEQAEDDFAAKLFGAGQVERADLNAQLQRMSRLHEQLSEDSVETALEIRALLTPDQIRRAGQVRARLKQLHEEMLKLLGPGNKP
jgi:Spy/CpxP family protein refolding chaperone